MKRTKRKTYSECVMLVAEEEVERTNHGSNPCDFAKDAVLVRQVLKPEDCPRLRDDKPCFACESALADIKAGRSAKGEYVEVTEAEPIPEASDEDILKQRGLYIRRYFHEGRARQNAKPGWDWEESAHLINWLAASPGWVRVAS